MTTATLIATIIDDANRATPVLVSTFGSVVAYRLRGVVVDALAGVARRLHVSVSATETAALEKYAATALRYAATLVGDHQEIQNAAAALVSERFPQVPASSVAATVSVTATALHDELAALATAVDPATPPVDIDALTKAAEEKGRAEARAELLSQLQAAAATLAAEQPAGQAAPVAPAVADAPAATPPPAQ